MQTLSISTPSRLVFEVGGERVTLCDLILPGTDNTKLSKGDGKDFMSVGLSLAPAKMSGYQVCSNSSAGCRRGCIVTSGYGGIFPEVIRGRIRRTVAFFEHRSWFLARMRRELERYQDQADDQGKRLVCRLNVFSDLPWEDLDPALFTQFPRVQFYDYTKHPKRMHKVLPANYHLTFSRSERNHDDCLRVLRAGGNVAVVWHLPDGSGRGERLKATWDRVRPKQWYGFPVVNGDVNDLRFLDPKGCVVGLYAKGRGKDDHESGFILPTCG
jgi:hypothetical protein